MRQLIRLLATSALLGSLLAAVAPNSASADQPVCEKRDAHGICIIVAQDPGSGGGTTPVAGGTTPVAAPICRSTDYGREVLCDGYLGYWSQSNQCYISTVSPQPAVTDPVWQGNTTGAIYNCSFYVPPGGKFPGTAGGWFWSPTAPARA